MADTPKHSVSVAGIVVDEQDRVLVIQRRDNGNWEPPGGVLELDETPDEGVHREVLEETGVEVEIVELSGVYKNMARSVVALVFRCRAVRGEPRRSPESSDVKWMDLSDISEAMDQAYAVRVHDAFDPLVHVRVHDGRLVQSRSSTSQS